ncbi:MAG: transposase [Methylococcales symbiont of Hymedesmia sp. n. MRB-2018]|nr:MAG: transposase [Methylococcales symbiont of Hymedesmia sp. n. MRB-2018]
MKSILRRAGFNKRSGLPIGEVIFTLSLWLWLKKDSIGMFARDSLQGMGKDVLYDTMNREDLNWRKCHELIAYKTVRTFQTGIKKAFVVDDSVVQRFGKKMPGISSHFDHTTGRHMMGQQVLTLGLSCEYGFVPLDNELFTSQTKVQGLAKPFHDGRNTVAKRHRVAVQQTKPGMVASMIRRALRAGIEGHYLLADAWFGSKAMIRLCQETALTAILRMKKSKLKYRVSETIDDKIIHSDRNIKALYQQSVRKQWQKIPGQKYQAKVVDVELNLAQTPKDDAQWIQICLLFVRGADKETKAQTGKHDWAVFLCTDTGLAATEILELYAMRWAIEVYFKEAKQHLGLLKEQSNHYAAYIASIHLTAIRFCLLVIAKQTQGCKNIAQVRQNLCHNSANISFSAKLWQVFRAIITGALDVLKTILGDAVSLVLETIEIHIQCFFVQVLQLDLKTLRLEAL